MISTELKAELEGLRAELADLRAAVAARAAEESTLLTDTARKVREAWAAAAVTEARVREGIDAALGEYAADANLITVKAARRIVRGLCEHCGKKGCEA